MRARAQVAQSRFRLGGRQRWIHLLQVRRYVHVVGIRALDWRRPASREGRDASQERTLILNRGPSCSERQSNERVFRGRITVVHPSGPDAQTDLVSAVFVASRHFAGTIEGAPSGDLPAGDRDPTNSYESSLQVDRCPRLIRDDRCADSPATLS